jgi:lysylphosphatidylglycerol synthetase-like protein (DUF2156 family)
VAAGLIKLIDVTIGLACIVAGVFAIIATPATVLSEVDAPPVIVLWGILLVAGGFASALGRLTGVWILETAGIAGAAFGAIIYILLVGSAVDEQNGVITALCLIIVALLGMLRRYIELQIFLSEGRGRGILKRMAEILATRTPRHPAR